MSYGRSGEARLKKYQTVERDFIGPPKSDGRVPLVEEIIDLYETMFGWRSRRYHNYIGRYRVTSVTDCLVLCKVPDGFVPNGNERAGFRAEKTESFRVDDFKTELLVYRIVSVGGVSTVI